MDYVDSSQPHAKPRRQQKENVLEHCQGYVDKNGMWNNGFYCPRWGGPDDVYCCGDGSERFCCPEPVPELGPSTPSGGSDSDNALSYLPVVIGVSIGLFIFILGLVVGYFVCPCCPGRHGRHRKRSASAAAAAASAASSSTTVKRTLSVSLEAEATSAVIAAQALAPVQACQISPAPSSSTATDDVHLHCGCRWSPSTSRSTVVDVETTGLPTSVYHAHSPALPNMQTELDNMYNCSCEKALMNESKSLRRHCNDRGQLYHLLPSSVSTGQHVHAQGGSPSPSPICLESFRPSVSRCTRSDTRSPCHLHLQQQQQQQRLLSHRLLATSPPPLTTTVSIAGGDQSSSSSSSTSSRHGLIRSYGALASLQPSDNDRQRRDSGVLIEDVEPADGDTPTAPTTATSILPMPELVVERIGRMASAAR